MQVQAETATSLLWVSTSCCADVIIIFFQQQFPAKETSSLPAALEELKMKVNRSENQVVLFGNCLYKARVQLNVSSI